MKDKSSKIRAYKWIIFAFVCLILYIIRLWCVKQELADYTAVEYYPMGASVIDAGIEYQVMDYQDTTLQEIIDKYGEPEKVVSIYSDDKDRFCTVLLRIKNLNEEKTSVDVTYVELQGKYWRSQNMSWFLPNMNKPEDTSVHELEPGEEIELLLLYPIKTAEISENLVFTDWYLTFKQRDAKKYVLVRNGEY